MADMPVFDFTTGHRLDGDIRLIKTSDRKKFKRSLSNFLKNGYTITVINITMKVVPRIGRVISYFAELKLPVARKDKE